MSDEVIESGENLQKLTPQQKKTILEWVKYLGITVIKAIISKISSTNTESALILISLLLSSGCIVQNINPVINTKEPWEGHYMTVEEFNKATKDITLTKEQSIWVLSNESLKTIIENLRKK